MVTAPVELLRDVHIVDTPGTNAIIREHERLTTEFVPRSDLVLFVTSADRPFTETERLFLETIRDWGKKIVIVVNKVDIFEQGAELEEVLAFVQECRSGPARIRSRRAAGERAPGATAPSRANRRCGRRAGFEALEQFLRDTLDARGRFRLKLANPLGVGQALADRYRDDRRRATGR